MMDQTPMPLQPEKPARIRYSENWKKVEQVDQDGVDVVWYIKQFSEKPDPHDDEHSIFCIEYEFMVDQHLIMKKLDFSINTVHIVYGFTGGLINTPRFKYGLDDFRNSMQVGQLIHIKVIPKPPYWFFVEFNEVMSEVMKHEAVWR